ncbi:sensor domain-containing diguanylate cyclase [Marinobacterium sediminicola]|uniref:PAS domain S-box-containing protein/diguanylate cyclase (GGDEF) domain-containing protein n=1 Tax=Marinobacterium sediminicola TaxID=518898 RepID=A0ABY1S0C4_9GAMM|nr:diguanylate cyclase [Marinobacterium sediminicola]ULG69991.1 diguanylate cyclase [Marinobacterium sediminicola]SMR74445.1 PAS domain S-box-containing protein/diguanylate cyclase (GGDEF) domain-containing protein [Marinobacterium sediminicola]
MSNESPKIRKISYILVLLGLYLSVALYLADTRRDKEQQYLGQTVTLLNTIYQASLDRYALAMDSFHDGLLRRSDILPLLQAGSQAEGMEQQILREALYTQLLPDYHDLQARGIDQWQFHLPDGRSYLRFHAPHIHGDNLLSVRPSLQQVQGDPVPRYGFEVGRLFIGFRFVHPLIDQGKLIGSMETAVSFQQISQTLSNLAPGQAFLFLLHRETVDAVSLIDVRRQLRPAVISKDFLLDTRNVFAQSDTENLPLDALLAQLARDNLSSRLEQGEHFAVAIYHQSLGYSASFIPVYSFDSSLGGYILALHPQPLLTSIQWEFYSSLGISLLAILLLGWLLLSLHHQRQRALQQKLRLDAIGQAVGEGIYVLDLEGRTLYVNEATCRLTGFNAEKFYSDNIHHLIHCHAGNEHLSLSKCPIFTAALKGQSYESDEMFRRRTGELFPVVVTSRPMIENGKITGVVTVFRDISERKEHERKLALLATTDPLTGLCNRRAFIERLHKEQRLRQRLQHDSALIMIDFDHFKRINDDYGHKAGDEVLKHFARMASDCLRETDLLGRLGGEEFALLLPGTDLQGALHLAERIRQCLEQNPTQMDNQQIPMTLSIGLTLLDENDSDTSAALSRADKALYQAKNRGRNRVETA